MSALPLLTILIAVPLIAGALCLFVRPEGARWIALVATLIDLAISVYLWVAFNPDGAQWQFTEKVTLAKMFGGEFAWALGIDGIALLLIVLTAFLMPICIGASWRSIQKRVPEYMAAFMLLEALMLGAFAASAPPADSPATQVRSRRVRYRRRT